MDGWRQVKWMQITIYIFRYQGSSVTRQHNRLYKQRLEKHYGFVIEQIDFFFAIYHVFCKLCVAINYWNLFYRRGALRLRSWDSSFIWNLKLKIDMEESQIKDVISRVMSPEFLHFLYKTSFCEDCIFFSTDDAVKR